MAGCGAVKADPEKKTSVASIKNLKSNRMPKVCINRETRPEGPCADY
jgi:hypothetical protein